MSPLNERLHRALGQSVRNRRKILGISQETLSEAIGLSRSSIANIESGRQKISVETLYDLARVLEIAPADLLPPVADRIQVGKGVRLPKGLPKQRQDWIEDVLKEKESDHAKGKLDQAEEGSQAAAGATGNRRGTRSR